jgi:hypothetical protein
MYYVLLFMIFLQFYKHLFGTQVITIILIHVFQFYYRHTHDRVDQFFSRLSIMLDSGDIRTLEDLINAVKQCYTPSPTVEWLPGVLNIQEWLDPVLPNAGQVRGITEHQFYEFFKDPSSQGSIKAVVQSRYYSDSVEVSLPCHLLLGVPQATPHYVASRPLFHSKSETPEGRHEWYLNINFINTTVPY